MRKFKDFVQLTLLLILIYSCIMVLYIRSLFTKPKEPTMPPLMTVDIVTDFMVEVGEDIFEFTPCGADLGLAPGEIERDFGAFLIEHYPEHKDAIEEAKQDEWWSESFFEYGGISPFDDAGNDPRVNLIHEAFIAFCNERDDLRAYMLKTVEEQKQYV